MRPRAEAYSSIGESVSIRSIVTTSKFVGMHNALAIDPGLIAQPGSAMLPRHLK